MAAEGRSRVAPVDRAVVARPRLEARLDEFAARRLTTLIAGPGSGKSSVLRSWLRNAGHKHVWHTATAPDTQLAILAGRLVEVLKEGLGRPVQELRSLEAAMSGGGVDEAPDRIDALAGYLCSALDDALDDELLLVIDDLHELGQATPSARFIGGLCRNAPARLHLVLASRDEMPFPIERLVAHGHVGQLDGRDLAFDAQEIASVLEASGVAAADGLASALAEATNGWPAAVRLAIEAVRSRPLEVTAALADLHQPGGPLFAYLATEVFEHQPPRVRELIQTVAPLDRFSPELCTALDIIDAPATIRLLVVRGLFVDRAGDDLVLHRLVRDYARRTWPLTSEQTRHVLATASAWYAQQGDAASAVALAVQAEDWATVGELLLAHGPSLMRSGAARVITDAAERLPPAARTAPVARVVGEAYATVGQSDMALEWLDRAAPADGPVPAGIAWRRAMSHYLRDELHEVTDIHATTNLDGADPADAAKLAAWTAGAYRRLGDPVRARALAEEALAAAARTDDDSARAAAHTAGAFAAEIDGDRVASERHLRLGLSAAESAGDLLQQVRIRINRGSDRLESAEYVASIIDFDAALETASLCGFVSLRALALMNRGLANWCLGRLEPASADYEASSEAYRATGSRELAYAVIGRGDVYRERGDLELARVFYEEGLALAERTGDRQALVPGLYQSAKVIVADRPDEALLRAQRAVAYGWPDHAWALISLGWVALMTGDESRARATAVEAATAARASGDRFGSAEALELSGWTAPDPATRMEQLGQAAGIWRELGNPLRETTAELAMARVGGGPSARADADAAQRRLERLGIRPSPFGAAGLLTSIARRGDEAVEVRTLGGFRVLRHGNPIALSEWQSRKARDLLKLLIARRGHPVPRESIVDALWPDDDGAAAGNRLSVAVSMLRLALDPHKQFDAEHFVSSDKENVAVSLNAIAVDVEVFLADASTGLNLLRRGRREEALDRLSAAEAAYTGDFLEEHPYDEWALGAREEARATYIAVARALAELARDAGGTDQEIRLLLRTLERDPFDEASSIALVAAHLREGAHGEARAAYRRYAQRMEEIEVEAVPFPSERPARPGR